VFGFVAGAGIGATNALAESYWAEGLFVLGARSLLRGVVVYTTAAAIGAVLGRLVAASLHLARIDTRSLGRLLDALAVSLPVWPAIALYDRAMLPGGRTPAVAALVVGALLHVVLLAVGFRWTKPNPRGNGIQILAGCVLAAILGLAYVGYRTPVADAPRANLLLVVLDTVRADRLPSYGYTRGTSPEIDRFAEHAMRFSEFYSTSSWTIPSHASLFTGLFPSAHGATQTHLELARHHTTLAERLQNAGFQTWGASGNPFVGQGTQLSQGFERFERTWSTRVRPNSEPHPAVVGFRSFLADPRSSRPFFAFINLMEAHSPYDPPADLRAAFVAGEVGSIRLARLVRKPWSDYYTGDPHTPEELETLSDLYDGEIAFVSRIFGQLLGVLREDGRLDDTWVVLTSDHGEHFGENGRIEHMFTLYNTAVRVPLFIRPPGGTTGPQLNAQPAQLVDLFATMLSVLGAGDAAGAEGMDLLSSEFQRDDLLSEYHHPDQVLALFAPDALDESRERIDPHRRTLRALQRGALRFIWSSDGRHELYDLATDPGETHDLYTTASELPPAAAELMARLEAMAEDAPARGASAGVDDLDAETRDALRALGYAR
jgi:arylsulfatase A-like enzyme